MVKPKLRAAGMKICETFLYCSFLVINADPCMFMYYTVIFGVYVDDYIFWGRSRYNIYKAMESFN